MSKEKIIIYTDGGCRGNPGIGGWGVWLSFNDKEKRYWGAQYNTTNNRMELTAAIEALKLLKSKQIPLVIYSDSKYVLQGIRYWLPNWKKKNWKTANKKPVKNVDLWKELDELSRQFNIDWQWVKGHSNNKGNDIADDLANRAMDEYT